MFDCSRCFGRGYIAIYSHVENGVCFNCRGSGGGSNKAKSDKGAYVGNTTRSGNRRWFLLLHKINNTFQIIESFTSNNQTVGNERLKNLHHRLLESCIEAKTLLYVGNAMELKESIIKRIEKETGYTVRD